MVFLFYSELTKNTKHPIMFIIHPSIEFLKSIGYFMEARGEHCQNIYSIFLKHVNVI
jgi:hypothetical protein